MNLRLLTQDKLSFDPIKPLILRGAPSENASSVFTGNVVLTLARSTKISSIIVTFKSISTTYWPEGIGARGTRLFNEKILSEETLKIVESKKSEYLKLSAGVHRFPFVFIVPNSVVESIEDMYGRVRHTIEAKVNGPGVQFLNNWHITKPVLVLRAYMSDSLLTNNSFQDLSRTYEKHLPSLNIQLMVERAAFSSGDLFFIKLIMEPQQKKVRLEHMELTVTETRRYHVGELRASRTDTEQFTLQYLTSCKLIEGVEIYNKKHDELRGVFNKNGHGLDLYDTAAYRITFATPTCKDNIHHTTHFKDILFKHHLSIKMIVSYMDDMVLLNLPLQEALYQHASAAQIPTPPQSAQPSPSVTPSNSTPQSPTTTYEDRPRLSTNPSASSSSSHRFSKWFKKDHAPRKEELICLETAVTVFDCRLKEDYGRLPSYSELNACSTVVFPADKKSGMVLPSDKLDEDFMLQREPDTDHYGDDSTFKPQLCPCYFKFRRQMNEASQHIGNQTTIPLDKIPSIPPPDYAENV